MCFWESEVAAMVVECLPRQGSIAEKAEQIGYSVMKGRSRDGERGCSLGRGIFVNEALPPEERDQVILHELAECLLDTESQPLYCYRPTHSHETHKHRIARLVESFFYPIERQ
jgi:hypothetical protein